MYTSRTRERSETGNHYMEVEDLLNFSRIPLPSHPAALGNLYFFLLLLFRLP